MRAPIQIGTTGEVRFRVEPQFTIDFQKPGLTPVLSTPSLIWHLEHAAIAALQPVLEPDEISLGTEIEVQHLAATPPGEAVVCTARVVHVDGPKVDFQVEARDAHERIARGTHRRFVVRAGSFAKRLQAKTARAASIVVAGLTLFAGTTTAAGPDLSELARQSAQVHRFSTLFTAQDVRDRLSRDEGLDQAIQWCRDTAVSKVYVETFRDGYQADRATLEHARDRLRDAGLIVSGCVTPTQVGKRSTGWNVISCYTDATTQQRVGEIFAFTAALFDEIMIDDFWFTDCTCPACDQARQSRTVTVGNRTFPVAGDTWTDYRCELMVRLSQDRVLGVVRATHPKARLIIKYPQWYDRFHERGYEVLRQTRDFDHTWVGTETRDYANREWGGTVQYEAYFIMRWLGGLGGTKCGGGWYDWLGTTERTYVEQARQTILGGARESMLFCYGGLQRDTGPANVAALRTQIPELLDTAREVARRHIVGIATYKPANSPPGDEPRVFDFVGMLGLPLVPGYEFPTRAKAAFFSTHALHDPAFRPALRRFIRTGRPVLLTRSLADQLAGLEDLARDNVQVLPVKGDPKPLLELTPETLNTLRAPLLKPFKTTFAAPNQVALYLFNDRSWVVENFNDTDATVHLNGETLSIPARGWLQRWR